VLHAKPANGLRYWLVGGTLTHSTGRKMFGTLIMLKKPHRTHKSSARFVGTLLTCKTRCLKKYYNRTAEIIARTFDFRN
jgi:hypothetical protein